jgi:hypothetical protein
MWKWLTWHIKGYGAILAIIFIAFIVGLNLGLHGLLGVVQEDLALITHSRNHAHAAHGDPVQHLNPVQTIDMAQQLQEIPRMVPTPLPVEIVPQTQKQATTSSSPPAAGTPQPLRVSSLESRIAEVNVLVDSYARNLFNDIASRTPSIAADRSKVDIPIVLLTCNRPALLRKTIESLLSVRGIKKESIVVSQDGALQEVADIAVSAGLKLIQNLSGMRLRGGAASDGASRIAQHYKYSLTSVFDLHKTASAVIVLEDDLLFSPDLYEYLQFTAPVLEADPTAFVVSAWSDNGFKDKVREPYALRRTDYFPGLGWLLTRRLYKDELEPKWPASHWDHWLRAAETSKGRDIIYPQVEHTVLTMPWSVLPAEMYDYCSVLHPLVS